MTLIGHAMPATFFTGAGALALIATYRRAMLLKPGDSLSRHIRPETAETRILLWRAGAALTLFTAVACAYEIAALFKGHTRHKIVMHVTTYLGYTLLGLVAALEGKGLLPPDSYRLMFALSSLLEGLQWVSHAMMKDGSEMTSHMLLGKLSNVRALVLLFGVVNPGSVQAFIGGWALTLISGLWYWVLAFTNNDGPWPDPPEWSITPMFCLTNLFAIAGVAGMTARVYSSKARYAAVVNGRDDHEELQMAELDEKTSMLS